LDKPVSLRSVEPLDHAIFLQGTPFQPRLTIVSTLGTLRVAAKCVQQIRFTWML
jgi:hypothetical protein